MAPEISSTVKPKLGFSIDSIVGEDRSEPAEAAREELPPSTEAQYDTVRPTAGRPTLASHAGFYPVHCPETFGLSSQFYTSQSLRQCSSSLSHLQTVMPLFARHQLSSYPWRLTRCLHYRHPDPTTFLFHPFRKPKRIRTAFSPSQLLKLEHAFENNHYVVGAERKQLAQALGLTETQVKVWFQNRRTKHKRLVQEDEEHQTDQRTSGDVTQSTSSADEDETANCDRWHREPGHSPETS